MNINISERILAVAEKQGINKKVLAERMGIQPQNINSTVLNNPKFEMLEKVADTLGVTISELVGDAPGRIIEPQQKCPYCGHDLNIKVE
jgi:transcriptional regulator with XRE-family HTH domain